MTIADHAEPACYENGLPPEIDRLLEKLYQSAFCVTEYFRIFKSCTALNALVLHDSERNPVHALVYSVSGNEATLFNELFGIDQDYLSYFADFVFHRYGKVNTITVNRIRFDFDGFPRPYRMWRNSEDTVIQLPASVAEYQSRLGRHTKSNLNNYSNRLQKTYPDFQFTVSRADETNSEVIGRVIAMNRLRMESKRIVSGYDAALEAKIAEFCGKHGSTGALSVNGKIVAGTIYYEIGDHCFLEAISHDPEHNKDRVGQVCLYLTIKNAIEQGRKAFHFLWGDYEYKYRYLGEKQQLSTFSIYRSKRHKLLSFPTLLKARFTFFLEQLSYWWRKYVVNRFS